MTVEPEDKGHEGWVINDRMLIFELTIPLKLIHTKNDNYKGNYKVL